MVDHIIEGINYYILTPFEEEGIPVPMTYINALSPVDEALLILSKILLLLALVPLFILLFRMIKEAMSGTYI